MKHLLLSALAILLTITVFSQKEGTIKYVQVIQMKIEAPEGMEEMFKNMPKERSTDKVLIYSGEKSMYQNPSDKVGSEDEVISLSDDDMQIRFDFNEPEEKYFTDLEADLTLHQQDFMGKQFLVKGNAKKIDWKLGKGKKKIADYICMEATTVVKDTVPMTAWFTPQIPVNLGPSGYGGLPGMILQIDQNNGDLIITATEVDQSTAQIDLLVPPTKGKKVSKEQYKKIVDEKMKEMHAHSSGGTSIIIRQE